MRFSFAIPVIPLLIGTFLSAAAAQNDAPKPGKKIRKVIRAARPNFDESKNDIYFKDLFAEGLVGDRPAQSMAGSAAPAESTSQTQQEKQTAGWSALIDGTTLEDEIKSLNQELARSVTTPVKFKTTYNDVRQTMALLSMSFAIIREYDGEVRWQDHASAAQAALQQAATNARSNSGQAFNYCNARKFDLEDLIRGGSFAETEKAAAETDWGKVIGRTETMKRLEASDRLLKEWTADEKTFASRKSKIVQEAQWVAAIAEVIAKDGMDDADVDEYLALCTEMKEAAIGTIRSTNNDDYAAASRYANLISQSCNHCHEEWR